MGRESRISVTVVTNGRHWSRFNELSDQNLAGEELVTSAVKRRANNNRRRRRAARAKTDDWFAEE